MKNNSVIFVTTDQKWKAKISGVKVHFQQLQFLAGRKIQKIRYINYIGLDVGIVGTSDGPENRNLNFGFIEVSYKYGHLVKLYNLPSTEADY